MRGELILYRWALRAFTWLVDGFILALYARRGE